MPTAFRNVEAARASGENVNFSFGRNWQKYLERLTPERFAQARESLSESLGGADLSGRRFLDVGCGSGLFSLSALDLGAESVTSIDIDPHSVACAQYLRSRSERPEDWEIVRGSVLERPFLEELGTAEVVYSWGVLHHTGAMWTAVENVMELVRPGGLFCLALYRAPKEVGLHMRLKRTYNALPGPLRPVLASLYYANLVAYDVRKRRVSPVRAVREYGERSRGMSLWRDVEDWLGGLPCEFAEPEEVVAFAEPRGFTLEQQILRDPGACTEYLLRRAA